MLGRHTALLLLATAGFAGCAGAPEREVWVEDVSPGEANIHLRVGDDVQVVRLRLHAKVRHEDVCDEDSLGSTEFFVNDYDGGPETGEGTLPLHYSGEDWVVDLDLVSFGCY